MFGLQIDKENLQYEYELTCGDAKIKFNEDTALELVRLIHDYYSESEATESLRDGIITIAQTSSILELEYFESGNDLFDILLCYKDSVLTDITPFNVLDGAEEDLNLSITKIV
jgi:hypothetical protein